MSCCCCKCTKTTSYELEDVDKDESKSTTLVPANPGQADELISEVPISQKNSRTNSTAHIAVFEDDDADFNELLNEAEEAIEAGILPELILQGSSGSYFVKNLKKENIGVFKPRDEEPYGKRNPKWAKYIQKHCCPCCFGRGCLIPNQGYLSEAGASIVDFRLGLNVVPRTKVIRMASSTFHYGRIKRKAAKAKKNLADRFPAVGKRFHRIGLPLKIGSFQIYVKGYKDAIIYAQEFEDDPLPPDVATEFQHEFERLVILDYVIRNTDRGNDNWLIRYDKHEAQRHSNEQNENDGDHVLPRQSIPDLRQAALRKSEGISLNAFSCGCDFGLFKKPSGLKRARIKIAAIDNGLAFPFKHPDEWRAYPFRWAKLPFAKIPFSEETKAKFLPALSNISLIEQICNDLFFIFSLDKHFKKSLYDKQMSVLRGQVLNLANALREGKSPFDLVQMAPVRVIRDTDKNDRPGISVQVERTSVHRKTLKISPANTLMFDGDEYKAEVPNEAPVFSSW